MEGVPFYLLPFVAATTNTQNETGAGCCVQELVSRSVLTGSIHAILDFCELVVQPGAVNDHTRKPSMLPSLPFENAIILEATP